MHLIDYFHKIENIFRNLSPILLSNIQLIEYTPSTGVVRGEIAFFNNSILYFREYLNFKLAIPKKTYAYHYQREDMVIFRYDNAPHHPEISTFPHHKHVGENILPCFSPSLEQVICEIRETIIKY